MMQNIHMEFSLKTERSIKSNLLVQITSYYIINETIQLAPSLLFFPYSFRNLLLYIGFKLFYVIIYP